MFRLSDKHHELKNQDISEQTRFIQIFKVCSEYSDEPEKATFAQNLFKLVVTKISKSLKEDPIHFGAQNSEQSMYESDGACIPLLILKHPCWIWSDINLIIFESIIKKTSLEVLLKPVNFVGLLEQLNNRGPCAERLSEWLMMAQSPENKTVRAKICSLIHRLSEFKFNDHHNIQVNRQCKSDY